MKNKLLYGFILSAIIFLSPKLSFSQSVAINADSSKADASAILDLKSTKKGLLVPRMTMAQRDLVASPAIGLLIYQTDNTTGYYYYTGSLWTPLKSTGGGGGTGNYWTENEDQNIYNSNPGNVGIGSQNPASKLYVQTPLNTTGFTHLGLTDSIGTDSVLLADKLFSSYQTHFGGFTSTVPAVASFGTVKLHALQLHAGDTSWINLIPDGSIVIGKSAEYHGYYGSKLAVKADAGTKAITVLSSDGVLVSMVGSAAGSGVGTFTANDMNIYANSTPVITAQGSGNVGINTTTPVNKLQIGDVNFRYVGYPFAAGNGTNSFGFNQTDAITQLNSTTNISLTPFIGSGNVGINTTNPQNKLQIGNFGAAGYSNTDFAIGHGNGAMEMAVDDVITGMQTSGDFIINSNYPVGHVGIATHSGAQNKLQIGEMGTVGFNGNDLAIGNGTNATAMAQTAAAFQIASSTNIALLPMYGGTGRVGINTTSPKAQLDVEGFTNLPSPEQSNNFAYYGLGFDNFYPVTSSGGTNGNADVSIFASNNVMALQFDAFSDARIKSIIGVSNTAKDLQIINALQITDYTFKDKIKYGAKLNKKVIAQQVETVYPQVVSKHVDFVPNVYQLTNKIEKTANGYLLSFTGNHNITKDAKKLQVIMQDNSGKKEFDIVSIPSANQVIINATDLKADKLFVYGEEVNDFRTVDYEGLTTLNISATQEISKQVTDLQKTVAEQSKQIEALLHEVDVLKQPTVTKR